MPIGQIEPGRSGLRASFLKNERGFSLVEVMMALLIAAIGLLAAGHLIFIAVSSASLARSKGTAALAARNMLESLSDLYAMDQSHDQVATGNHGPQEIKIMNPNTGNVLNHFSITWTAGNVQDPRPAVIPVARRVRVTVTPIRSGNVVNYRPPFNKILNIATVFSPEMK
jgi:prepilin-type N-terminal cleavage/methylation domain-containing protein